MKSIFIGFIFLFFNMSVNSQVISFEDIPEDIMKCFNELGINDNLDIDSCEGRYLNVIFDKTRGNFTFIGKKVGFITGSNGNKVSNKKEYFNDEKDRYIRHTTPIKGSLYIFSEAQKEEAGGFDAVIVYWCKVLSLAKDLPKKLNSSNQINNYNQLSIINRDVYIYEYTTKKPNQVHIGFIIINNDLIVQNIHFVVNFSKSKVKDVFRRDNAITNNIQYLKREDGNILIESSNFLCYNSENFISREKRIPDNIYKMISSSFLEMTNEERLSMLSELSSN